MASRYAVLAVAFLAAAMLQGCSKEAMQGMKDKINEKAKGKCTSMTSVLFDYILPAAKVVLTRACDELDDESSGKTGLALDAKALLEGKETGVSPRATCVASVGEKVDNQEIEKTSWIDSCEAFVQKATESFNPLKVAAAMEDFKKNTLPGLKAGLATSLQAAADQIRIESNLTATATQFDAGLSVLDAGMEGGKTIEALSAARLYSIVEERVHMAESKKDSTQLFMLLGLSAFVFMAVVGTVAFGVKRIRAARDTQVEDLLSTEEAGAE